MGGDVARDTGRSRTGSSSGQLCAEFPVWLQTALVWLGGAAVAGIAGNAAYEALKSLGQRMHAVGNSDLSREDAILVGGIALAVRCDLLGLEPPELNTLTCQAYPLRDGGWNLVLTGEQLAATVDIPAGNPVESRSVVTIIRHRQIERFRELDEDMARSFDDANDRTRQLPM